MNQVAIIVPCYNEENVLAETVLHLRAILHRMVNRKKIALNSCIYFVDDGSKDSTWQIIEELSRKYSDVHGIKLSRNVGHQNALLAGLLTAKGDALVSIDADLQDDENVIEQMVDEFNEHGVEIVYGARSNRDTDTKFKHITAEGFYKFMRIMGVELVDNHADFRLMSRLAVQALKDFKEVNLFLRGIIPLLGFRSSVIYYKRSARFAGTSKYPLVRMLSLALNGITSFSVTPLRIITVIGFVIFIISSALGAWSLLAVLFNWNIVPGWASTVLPIYFLGGVQVLCIGILGEYVGKVYQETKHRPRFIIEKIVGVPLDGKEKNE